MISLAKSLLETLEELPPILAEAAEDYRSCKPLLLGEVDRQMEEHPDLDRLLGDAPFSVMYNNHKNHLDFMENVFSLGLLSQLVEIVPWVLRAYRSRGFAFDYFPITLRAWITAIQRHLQPNHQKPIIQTYQWMIDHLNELNELAEETPPPPQASNDPWQTLTTPVLQALLRGNMPALQQLIEKHVHSTEALQEFYLQVLQTVMVQIGQLWEKNEVTEAQEHMASALVGRLMASTLYQHITLSESPKGKALVTAAPNEYHELGARMVADFLEMEGWEVFYLGANTPVASVIDLLLAQPFCFLAISASMPFHLNHVQELIQAVRQHPHLQQVKILVGGRAFERAPGIWQKLQADGYAANAREACLFVEEWRPSPEQI